MQEIGRRHPAAGREVRRPFRPVGPAVGRAFRAHEPAARTHGAGTAPPVATMPATSNAQDAAPHNLRFTSQTQPCTFTLHAPHSTHAHASRTTLRRSPCSPGIPPHPLVFPPPARVHTTEHPHATNRPRPADRATAPAAQRPPAKKKNLRAARPAPAPKVCPNDTPHACRVSERHTARDVHPTSTPLESATCKNRRFGNPSA